MMFSEHTITFLRELAQNNNREWFNANKLRYEQHVREPAFAFIEAMQPRLARLTSHFVARASKSGGSLMRVYRDVRFSKNKLPYKTNIGIQFRHEVGKDVHAPGYYVHIEPDQAFVGVGIWHPDAPTLKRIRSYIVAHPTRWTDAQSDVRFARFFHLGGDSLKRAPKGFDPDHPLIEDIRRKDFIAIAPLAVDLVVADDFDDIVAGYFGLATPLMGELCRALGVPF